MARRSTRTRTGARTTARKPVRRGGPRAGADPGATRAAVFAAAADAFSRRGFDGVTVDHIARVARVNKAMIYYHFDDKLALYREIVREILREGAARVTAIAESPDPPAQKIARFVEAFAGLTDTKPYLPTLMVREIAEGAPHLDTDTLAIMRTVFMNFARILQEGQQHGAFRPVHPVLAYLSIIAPLVLNAARERAGAQAGRAELPMFTHLSHADVTRHMQHVAVKMLQKD